MKMQQGWVEATANACNPTTGVIYRSHLKAFWKWYIEQDKPDITPVSVNQYKQHLLTLRKGASTISVAISAIKKMVEIHMLLVDPLNVNGIFNFVKTVRPKRVKRHRTFPEGDIARVLACCEADSTPYGVRDKAIISLAFGAGLRRSEIGNLHLHDYHSTQRLLYIIQSKRNKDREVPVSPWVAEALDSWILVRDAVPTCGAVFVGLRYQGYRGLCGQAIYNIITERLKEVGISTHPHELRADYITRLLRKGVDPLLVAQLAGHSNVKTTMAYDRRGLEDMQQAVKVLDDLVGG